MGGFAMIIFSCLFSGADCREDEVRVESLFSCAIQGQAAQAKWLKQNPGRYIKKWVCDPRQLTKA